eukprot:3554459-Pleurochrysis_carterae.AAC.2
MVRLKFDGNAFSSSRVRTDIARTLLSRIPAFQHERRLSFCRKRHSHDANYKLPKSAAIRASPIGKLRLADGLLSVKASLVAVIEQQGVNCDHLSSISPTTTIQPSSSSTNQDAAAATGGTSCRNNNHNDNSYDNNTTSNDTNGKNACHATSASVIAARIAQLQTREPRRYMPFQDNG